MNTQTTRRKLTSEFKAKVVIEALREQSTLVDMYTCPTWEKACEGIRMSMDGRRRCLDNVWIERFWRTIKREYVYINPTDNVKELREGIKNYIEYYNTKRPHQGIEHQIPMMKYAKIAA